MRVPVVALLIALCVSACAESESPTTEVRVLIDIDSELAAQLLSVRVFDTDRQLALEQIVSLDEVQLPIVLPLFPDGEGTRSYHVVLQLSALGGADLGTQRVIGEYVDGESRVLHVAFRALCSDTICSGRETCRDEAGEPLCVQACFAPQQQSSDTLPNPIPCDTEVYVDGSIGEDMPGACFGPEAPCASVGYALANYLNDGQGGVINVAGGSTYEGFGIGASSSGTPDVPLVVRAWPGSGRPIFDGQGEGLVIGTCCSDNSANHFVLEGLEVINGYGQGIQLHGRAVQNAVIRDCVVSDTTLERDGASFEGYSVEAGGIVVRNGASGVLVQGNVVRGGRGSGEELSGLVFGASGISVVGTNVTLDRNTITDNSGPGIRANGGEHRIVGNRVERSGASGLRLHVEDSLVEDNWACASAAHGIELADSHRVDVRHNSVAGSALNGVFLRDFSTDVMLSANVVAFGGAAGVARLATEESEPVDSMNLYWMNAAGAYEGTEPDGDDWVDEIDPMFTGLEGCELELGADSPAVTLVDGGRVGARPRAE